VRGEDEGTKKDKNLLPPLQEAYGAYRESGKEEGTPFPQLGSETVRQGDEGIRGTAQIGAKEVCEDHQKGGPSLEV